MRPDRRAMRLAGLCLALPLLVHAGKPDRSLLTDSLAASAAPLPADGLLVLLASLPDCHYCETVRSHYLLPLARAANTGISAMIDPRGRVVAALGLGEMGVVDAPLPAALPPTVYSRTGDVPVIFILSMISSLTCLVFSGGLRGASDR